MNDKSILLVGNGINYVHQFSWGQILDYLQKIVFKKEYDTKKMELKNCNDYTLVFEYICNEYQKKTLCENETAFNFLKKETSKYISEKCNFERNLWEKFDVILTTNFDNSLDITSHRSLKTTGRDFGKIKSDFIYNKTAKRIYYIHGYKDSDQLCFGFGGYSSFVKDILNSLNKRKAGLDENQKCNNWIDYFFRKNQEIHIFGFGFSPEEIDIWTILEKRKQMNIQNTIKVYDIEHFADEAKEKERMRKEMLLKSFGINYIGVGKEEGLTEKNSDLYPLILKKINTPSSKN